MSVDPLRLLIPETTAGHRAAVTKTTGSEAASPVDENCFSTVKKGKKSEFSLSGYEESQSTHEGRLQSADPSETVGRNIDRTA